MVWVVLKSRRWVKGMGWRRRPGSHGGQWEVIGFATGKRSRDVKMHRSVS
jgi:hypothetical protein